MRRKKIKSINCIKYNTTHSFPLRVFILVAAGSIACYFSINTVYGLYFGHNTSIIVASQSSTLLTPEIETTEKGKVHLLWVNNNSLFITSSQDNGTTFNHPASLSNNDRLASSPKIAATENGKVYVVWIDKNRVSYSSSQDNGSTFNTPILLSDSDRIASFPQIDATEKGNVYVLWVEKNTNNLDSDIKFRSSNDSGKSFYDDKRLSRKNDVLSSLPQIAATEAGSVYVVRVDKNSTSGINNVIFRSSINSGENFGRGISLSGDSVARLPISYLQSAVTENGRVFVVWSQNNVEFKEILGSGDMIGRTILLSNNLTSSHSPQISATENGNVYVVWIEKSTKTGISKLLFKSLS